MNFNISLSNIRLAVLLLINLLFINFAVNDGIRKRDLAKPEMNSVMLERKAVENVIQPYLNKGTTESIASVNPGDMVYVPREENVVRELSDFVRDVILPVGLFSIFN